MNGVSVKQPVCMKCGRTLTDDEIGIHKKMINRGATEFFCLACLAARFGTSTERLMETARRYQDGGCILFRGLVLE